MSASGGRRNAPSWAPPQLFHLLAWFLVSTAQPPGCHTHTCAHTRALCVAIHYLHSSGKILEKIRIWIICRAGRFILIRQDFFFFLPKIKLIKVKSSSCCHIQYPSIRLPGGFSRFRMCACSTFPIRARTPASIFQSQRRVFGSRLESVLMFRRCALATLRIERRRVRFLTVLSRVSSESGDGAIRAAREASGTFFALVTRGLGHFHQLYSAQPIRTWRTDIHPGGHEQVWLMGACGDELVAAETMKRQVK